MASLPPHLPPFKLANAGREYRVTPNDHGSILYLGNASDGRTGTFVIQWVPDNSFSGSFAVVARVYGKPASDNGVPFNPVPYRRVTLANVASDRTLVADALATSFLIEVPSNGIAVGLLCACTDGFGTLYSWDLNGPAT
jgi:hypothetical protein